MNGNFIRRRHVSTVFYTLVLLFLCLSKQQIHAQEGWSSDQKDRTGAELVDEKDRTAAVQIDTPAAGDGDADSDAGALHFYKIQIGVFEKAGTEAFEAIADLGLVEKEAVDAGTKVRLGSYADLTTAQDVLFAVKQRGFKSAFIQAEADSYPVEGKYYMVQLGSFWRPRFEEIQADNPSSMLRVESTDYTLRVLVGPFASKSAAQAVLKNAKSKGYKPILRTYKW